MFSTRPPIEPKARRRRRRRPLAYCCGALPLQLADKCHLNVRRRRRRSLLTKSSRNKCFMQTSATATATKSGTFLSDLKLGDYSTPATTTLLTTNQHDERRKQLERIKCATNIHEYIQSSLAKQLVFLILLSASLISVANFIIQPTSCSPARLLDISTLQRTGRAPYEPEEEDTRVTINFARVPHAASTTTTTPAASIPPRAAVLLLQAASSQATSGQASSVTLPTYQQVPYKTFYVTQACEWKSSLFVPTSNDVHFAQHHRQDFVVAPDTNLQATTTTMIATTSATPPPTRTILSTTSKALILALPIPSAGQTFVGFEPACSIRLMVPRNMRILAKLTSRKLSFEQQQQQQQVGEIARDELWPDKSQLWLNVSQTHELSGENIEQRTIETDGNVLAFRFLLSRHALTQAPDTRFQVILTAFQTLGENSDFNQPFGPATGGLQFICDTQRLISADLRCDGFKNCQDGHDEDSTTCASTNTSAGAGSLVPKTSATNDLAVRNQVAPSGKVWNFLSRDSNTSLAGLLLIVLLVVLALVCCTCCLYGLLVLVRARTSGHDDDDDKQQRRRHQQAIGLQRQRRRQQRRARWQQLADGGGERAAGWWAQLKRLVKARGAETETETESDRVARGQNVANMARLKEHQLADHQLRQQQQFEEQERLVAQQQQVRQIQSILKRPIQSSSGSAAPLARFESIPTSNEPQPPPPPPRMSRGLRIDSTVSPSGGAGSQHIPKRGALASSLATSARDSGRLRLMQQQRRTTPDFRPTPAVRHAQLQQQPPLQPPHLQQQQHSTPVHMVVNPSINQPAIRSQQQRLLQQQPAEPAQSSSPTPGHHQHHQQINTRPPLARTKHDELKFKSQTSKIEQTTSTSTGTNERLTVYEYSSSVAQYSESHLMRTSGLPNVTVNQQQQARLTNQNNQDKVNDNDDDNDDEESVAKHSHLI